MSEQLRCACGCEQFFDQGKITIAGNGERIAYSHLSQYEYDRSYNPHREHGTLGGSSSRWPLNRLE
jgi:hypothetical protein